MGSGPESLSFVNIEWMKQLYRQLKQLTDERAQELDRLGDDFVDPLELTRSYVEPCLQAYRPLFRHRGVISPDPCQPAFSLLNNFFASGAPTKRDGSHQLILLGEPGAGKGSLLLMIKLMHLAGFWPTGYHCLLLKLDEDALDQMEAVDNKAKTILLIDALNEGARWETSYGNYKINKANKILTTILVLDPTDKKKPNRHGDSTRR